jgi:hypothetical protein
MDVSISRSLTARLASALVFTILTLWTSHATACDVCAIYFGTALQETRPGLWAGVAQQFTAFDTTQLNGDKVPGRVEWMDSAITQFQLGYNFHPKIGAKLTRHCHINAQPGKLLR